MDIDGVYNNLRQKLDIMGYTQPLPLSALSLVGSIYHDLIQTTSSLKDTTLKLSNLLEEKSCWELGVEPYKCDNARLLNECNNLNLDLIKQREKFEEKICDLASKIRHLDSDKRFLEEHCVELEKKIRELSLKCANSKLFKIKDATAMSKKPAFVTTVRSGVFLPDRRVAAHDSTKCSKCNSILWRKEAGDGIDSYGPPNQEEIEKIHDHLKDYINQVALYKKKVETRDREITRLNSLLTGGRPTSALARDCCYKNVGELSEDLEILQREKSECLQKMQDCQEQMHVAKSKAVELHERNLRLQDELDILKKTSLDLEKQANDELNDKEQEISELKSHLKKFRKKMQNIGTSKSLDDCHYNGRLDDKRKLNEKLNELTMKEQELTVEVERLHKKNVKLKMKLNEIQKDSEDDQQIDEEKLKLKTERDFYQKEYLSLIKRTGSEKEIEFLQMQIKGKNDELCQLRSELQHTKQSYSRGNYSKPPMSATSNTSSSSAQTSAAVKASILRLEREKDCFKSELDCIRMERDTIKERFQCSTETQLRETHRLQEQIEELSCKIENLEKDKRELEALQIPGKTHNTLMKQEIEELKKRIFELQGENCKFKTNYNQIKILHEQTERTLVDVQNKFKVAETQLENAESRLNALGTSKEFTSNEVGLLKNEVLALKSMNKTIENEKEKFMGELDIKTEKVYHLENEVKTLNRKNKELEKNSVEFQEKYEKLSSERKNRENELHESSFESKTLRQKINALKASRDESVAENGRLTAQLTDQQSDMIGIKVKLKDSEKEVERLKKQLQQYVNEVQKAEDLLMSKEREREEMLEHYRCLSHDAVILEGNNQSLEMEAIEQKQKLCEAEAEVCSLREELCIKNGIIEKMEKKVSCLTAQCKTLEKELEQSYDDQRLIKVDLDAMKELCEKLDLQRDKLNAELEELGAIRTKLERENERLRRDTDRSVTGNRASSDMIEKILDKTRDELEDTRRAGIKLSQEIKKLKEKCEELEIKYNVERERAAQKDALAKEYSIQVQELRHNLTDDRFKAAQLRDQSPRFTTI